VTVAGHQAVVRLVALVRERRDVRVDLGLESNSQHPPGSFADDLIKSNVQFRAGIIISHYS
jgi:hypothetical protein